MREKEIFKEIEVFKINFIPKVGDEKEIGLKLLNGVRENVKKIFGEDSKDFLEMNLKYYEAVSGKRVFLKVTRALDFQEYLEYYSPKEEDIYVERNKVFNLKSKIDICLDEISSLYKERKELVFKIENKARHKTAKEMLPKVESKIEELEGVISKLEKENSYIDSEFIVGGRK